MSISITYRFAMDGYSVTKMGIGLTFDKCYYFTFTKIHSSLSHFHEIEIQIFRAWDLIMLSRPNQQCVSAIFLARPSESLG